MNVTAIASAGLSRAFDRFDRSAQRTAQDDADYPGEVVEQVQAKSEVRANIAVIKTADQMLGELLDIKV